MDNNIRAATCATSTSNIISLTSWTYKTFHLDITVYRHCTTWVHGPIDIAVHTVAYIVLAVERWTGTTFASPLCTQRRTTPHHTTLRKTRQNMAFRRDVPALDEMVLKFISKSPRQLNVIINDQTLARAHRIGKPAKSRTHKIKQEVIRALLLGGRLSDDTLPASFFHPSMTRVEIIGTKISNVFVEMVQMNHIVGWIN